MIYNFDLHTYNPQVKGFWYHNISHMLTEPMSWDFNP